MGKKQECNEVIIYDRNGHIYFRHFILNNTFSKTVQEMLKQFSIIENVDFSGKLIQGVDFSDVTFKNCSFVDTKLANIKFKGAKFKNCDLHYININNMAKFSLCELDTRTLSTLPMSEYERLCKYNGGKENMEAPMVTNDNSEESPSKFDDHEIITHKYTLEPNTEEQNDTRSIIREELKTMRDELQKQFTESIRETFKNDELDKLINTESIKELSMSEFSQTGLLQYVNTITHAFGISLLVKISEDGLCQRLVPARTKFRGFPEKDNLEMYGGITKFIFNNISNIASDFDWNDETKENNNEKTE